MAVSIALMFGRLGSIVGSNLVGVILAVNCVATFYLYTCFILGKFQYLRSLKSLLLNNINLISVCAVLSLFLPV